MAFAEWPAELGEWLLGGHQIELAPAILETNMDKGPPKRRALTDATPEPLNAMVEMTRAQWIVFRAFYVETLANGVLPFTKIDPIYQAERTYQFRADQGPRATPQGTQDALIVSLPLQIMPG